MTQEKLTQLLMTLKSGDHGSSKYIYLPLNGGYLMIEVSFDDGEIEVVRANSNIFGDYRPAREFSIGFSSPDAIASSAMIALQNLSTEAKECLIW